MAQPRLRAVLKTVRFSFFARDAKRVAVAGTFNHWDTTVNSLRQGKDGSWTRLIRIKPGRHEYKFVVDGERWVDDPQAQERTANDHGGVNCVMIVE